MLSGYVLDAIEVWGNEFNSRVAKMKNEGSMQVILACVGIMLVHLIVFECLLFRKLEKEYRFYSKVYDRMIPEPLLKDEKIVLQELINEGFIVTAK